MASPGTAPGPASRETRPSPFQPSTPSPPISPVGPPLIPFQLSTKSGDVERPVTPPTSGGTVLIQRGAAKPKVLGILVEKKDSANRFDIDKPAVTIGRAPGNHLVVDHATVSRQHATIKLEGED